MEQTKYLWVVAVVMIAVAVSGYFLMSSKKDNPVENNSRHDQDKTSEVIGNKEGEESVLPNSELDDNSQSIKNEEIIVNGVSFKMIWIQGGTFTMGATAELPIVMRNLLIESHCRPSVLAKQKSLKSYGRP